MFLKFISYMLSCLSFDPTINKLTQLVNSAAQRNISNQTQSWCINITNICKGGPGELNTQFLITRFLIGTLLDEPLL